MSLVSMEGIGKRYGTLQALHCVRFELRAREIHALVGENGAGKSTLMKILYGMETPDQGRIRIEAQEVTITNPQANGRLGIGMVHQRLKLLPSLTVAENVALGVEPRRWGVFDVHKVRRRIDELNQRFGIGMNLDPDAKVAHLPIGLRQRVEILKVLYRGARILIFDEPTAVLTQQEARQLFLILRELQAEGNAVIYISHKIDEILEVTERITVLRRGEVQGELLSSQATPALLTRLMVGQDLPNLDKANSTTPGPAALTLRGVTARNDEGFPLIKNLSLDVCAGEIVGIAGVEGNGQRELIELIAGLRPTEAGRILLGSRDITTLGVFERRDAGIALIPEDRDREGICGDFSVEENLIATALRRAPLSRRGVTNPQAIRAYASRLIDTFAVRPPDPRVQAKTLSGGNLQKVVVARELASEPQVVLAAHPSRGIDVAAMRAVHQELLELRNQGCAILLVSGDLDELLAVSDRILALYEGNITGSVLPQRTTREEIGALMLGQKVA